MTTQNALVFVVRYDMDNASVVTRIEWHAVQISFELLTLQKLNYLAFSCKLGVENMIYS